MKKLLALLAVLAFGTQTSFAAPAGQINPQAQQNIGRRINATCNRMVNGQPCNGQIKFQERQLKCNKCGALANSESAS